MLNRKKLNYNMIPSNKITIEDNLMFRSIVTPFHTLAHSLAFKASHDFPEVFEIF